MLGVTFLLLGLLGGKTLLPVLRLIPFPALGALLIYVGVQHGLLTRDLRGPAEWLPALAIAATAWFTRNLAIGFAAGASLHFAIRAVSYLRTRRLFWRPAITDD
jgi:xanthine/uracil/vitamin C permease (AzgA family)